MNALQAFVENLPRRPYCTDEPRLGQTARGRDEALRFSHIQPNTPGKVVWLVFDVDEPDGATIWDRRHAPPPTLAAENPGNGHAHLIYQLEAPVPRTAAARSRPLLFLAAVQEGLRLQLGADPGYSGQLCKNPQHSRWNTEQWADAYSLGEIAEWINLPTIADDRRPAQAYSRSRLRRPGPQLRLVRRPAAARVSARAHLLAAGRL